MRVERTPLDGVLVFLPDPHRDERGLFTRTFDAAIAAEHGLEPNAFIQDSQSRSRQGTVRGMHGRAGRGEAKLVRCARGAVYDVLVDIRRDSATFGSAHAMVLDDVDFAVLYVPPGFLHGFQSLTDQTDICYRIDREHDPSEDLAVRYDDPDLKIDWPAEVTSMSARDLSAGSWARLLEHLLR